MNQDNVRFQPARLRANSLRKKLQSQDCVIGTFLEIPAPQLVELLGLAGFDFVVIDREHGPIDLKDTENLVRSGAATEINVVVRPTDCDPLAISQPLDCGAAAVQVPQIASAEMARTAVRSSKYHPLGMRGLQPYVRSASYRACDTSEYLTTANEESVLIVQVEGAEGVLNLDSILNVEGVEVVFIGPYDLSQSLGIPAQVKHPRVLQAMVDAVAMARRAGKRIGTYCDDVEAANEYRKLGVSYLTVSIDAYIFLSAARAMVSRLRA